MSSAPVPADSAPTSSPNPAPTPTSPVPIAPINRPVLNSADIFRDTREVAIQHGEEFYRLRLTKSGKLILHK
ncbi:hemin uptake protein HemP [Planctomicrobium sp. SH527]|uniref:hemin uptake protein HemP n=1 Tax=Planctomicrobium sp. SH527 TaxID=3448123 RepID=UPI003F5B6367